MKKIGVMIILIVVTILQAQAKNTIQKPDICKKLSDAVDKPKAYTRTTKKTQSTQSKDYPMTSKKTEEINQLIKGYEIFQATYLNEDSILFNELVQHGQKPRTLVIACSDSRVDPAIIMTAKPGDLFVIRNVANLVPPLENSHDVYHGTSAALQFGITGLNIGTIIIVGHSQCGGIQSLFDRDGIITKTKSPNFIDKWMQIAMPAYTMVKRHNHHASAEEQAILCGKYSLINSLNNLHTFPWIEERIKAGTLSIHAWYFNLAERTMDMYDPTTHTWKTL